jgi:hypothetical protein
VELAQLGLQGLALLHQLQQLVLQGALAPLEAGHLLLDGGQLLGAGHLARNGPRVLVAGLGRDHVDLVLQAGLVALDGGQAAVALGGELVHGGQGVGQLGQPGVLGQRAAPVVEAVDRRVVGLELEQGTLLGDRGLHQ